MKETMDRMLNHPIASAILISAIAGGITQVVTAMKGKKEET